MDDLWRSFEVYIHMGEGNHYSEKEEEHTQECQIFDDVGKIEREYYKITKNGLIIIKCRSVVSQVILWQQKELRSKSSILNLQ